MYYDGQLQALQEQIARKKQLTAMESELIRQRDSLSERVRELNEIRLAEQADVDRLEGRSLAAFYYNVIGKMDQKLDQERREAYAARVKYDAAAGELEAVRRELDRCQAELVQLRDCEQQYQKVLRQKAAAVKSAGGADAEEILKLEARIVSLKSQEKELREAISAGTAARYTADDIMSALDSAEGWGTWDLFGGGLIADLAKHGELDEAQSMIEQLQSQLRRFKTELADVTVRADFQVNVDGFLRFADYFFDGLFADWAVMDRIGRAKEQVDRTVTQIAGVLRQLEGRLRTSELQRGELEKKLDALVREAQI